jgi:hypothetical protein
MINQRKRVMVLVGHPNSNKALLAAEIKGVKLEKSFPQLEGAPFLISNRSITHRDSCWHTNVLIVG